MARKKQAKKKLFRESLKLQKKFVRRNYLKNLRQKLRKTQETADVFQRELMFMCWAYDLEFWTIDYAASEYEYSKDKIGRRIIFPLANAGYVYKYFDKLTPSQTLEDHLFRDETKASYRVRYALTQKARLLVQRFYRSLEESV